MDDEECGRKAAEEIKSLANVQGLSLKCNMDLHEDMLQVLTYVSKTMVWNVQPVQMDDLGGRMLRGENR